MDQRYYRIVDANFNRAREGLRVCEDICRFFHNRKRLTREYKTVRHRLTAVMVSSCGEKLIGARDVSRDVGRGSTAAEFRRKGVADIFYANSQRVKESLRVLEELAKLWDARAAGSLKRLRYRVYRLEQDTSRGL